MRWPVLLLAVPAALLGLAALPARRFRDRAGAPRRRTSTSSLVLPLALLVLGAGPAWWLWRRDAGRRPGPRRSARCGRCSPARFYLDAVQDAPGGPAGARARRAGPDRADEAVVDGAVEGTGAAHVAARARWSPRRTAAALPRAATAVLTGALLLGVAAAIYGGVPR